MHYRYLSLGRQSVILTLTVSRVCYSLSLSRDSWHQRHRPSFTPVGQACQTRRARARRQRPAYISTRMCARLPRVCTRRSVHVRLTWSISVFRHCGNLGVLCRYGTRTGANLRSVTFSLSLSPGAASKEFNKTLLERMSLSSHSCVFRRSSVASHQC